MNVGFIFARGGSKEIPRKNLVTIGGKPLVGLAVEQALNSRGLDRVYISTDDEEIAAVASDFGAEVPFLRPSYLAQDASEEIHAWKHAVKWLREQLLPCRAFVSVPPTAPLRNSSDIDACISIYDSGRYDIVVTVDKASANPYFNMVQRCGAGYKIVCRPESVGDSPARRQAAPEVFAVTTVAYVASPEYVLRTENVFDGAVGVCQIESRRAIDIDTLLDLEIARHLAGPSTTND